MRASLTPVVRRRVLLGAGIVLVLLLALATWMVFQLLGARDQLTGARTSAAALQEAVKAGDGARAQRELSALQTQAGDARSSVSGPQWTVATWVPFVGDDVAAVRTVAAGVDDLAQDALPGLVDLSATISADSFQPVDGRLDLAPLREAAPQLRRSAAAVEAPSRAVARIDRSGLLGPLRGPVGQAQDSFTEAASLLRRASTAADVLPDALGGTKRYLVVFQNPAEIRATGGMPGAWTELVVRDGTFRIGRQGSANGLVYDESPTRLTADEEQYYGTRLGADFRGTAFTPDYPRSGELVTNVVTQRTGKRYAGVLALDPVVLGYLLDATGDVRLADGTRLTPDNAADELLNGVYLRIEDPQRQDAVFAAVTRAVFGRIAAGSYDSGKAVAALTRGGEERRVLVWLRDRALEQRLDGTMVAGQASADDAQPAYGIYLNDSTGAKMQYYLDVDARTTARCVGGDAQEYTSTVTLSSRAPADAASLPDSVIGPGLGARPGHMIVSVDVVAPAGGSVPLMTVDGEEPTYFRLRVAGRPASRVALDLGPGEKHVLRITTSSAAGQTGDTVYGVTPTIRSGAQDAVLRSACD